MQELVSPETSARLIPLAAVLVSVVCGLWGWRALGARGLPAILMGPLVLLLWRFHNWINAYNHETGQLGLGQVKILVLELLMFVALGAALGWFWSRLSAFSK